MKYIKQILYFLIIVFTLGIIILNFIGIKPYRVISDSMAPRIYKNSLGFIKEYKDNDIVEGDIIAFFKEGKLVLHRVYKIEENKITTKGDNNDNLDSPINYSDIVGIFVFSIPLIGLLFSSIYIWIILLLLIVGKLFIQQIIKEVKKKQEI